MRHDDEAALLARVHALERNRAYDLRDHEAPAREVERDAALAGSTAVQARAWLVRADRLCTEGRRAEALDLLTRAVRTARELQDPELTARTHFVHYVLHVDAGNTSEARWHALLAVRDLPPSAPAWLRAEHLLALTVVLDDALDSYPGVFDELLGLARAEGDHRLELFTVNNMAWTALEAGDLPTAVALTSRMRDLQTVHGVALRSPDLDTIAAIERADGRPEEALTTIRAALGPTVVGDVHADHAVIAHLTAAGILRDLRRTGEAERELAVARATALERDLPGLLAQVEHAQAELCADQGRWEQAYTAHVRYDEARRALEATQDASRALLAQAEYDSLTARRDRDHYRHLANTDVLTSLPNRRAVQEHVETLLSAVPPGGTALCLIDVDHFKAVNDTFSHDVGDLVLQELATTLTEVVRDDPGLLAARLGGEEFVLVTTGDADRARRVAETVRLVVAGRDWSALCPGLPVTVSIGAVSTSEGPGTFSALLSTADARLYAAKRAGRNRVVAAAGPPGEDTAAAGPPGDDTRAGGQPGQDGPGAGAPPAPAHPPRRNRP